MKTIILLLFLFIGSKNDLVQDVDMIEFNVCFQYKEVKNPETKEVTLVEYPAYRQLIMWEWNTEYSRYDSLGFIMLETEDVKGIVNISNRYNIIKEGEYTKLTFYSNDIRRFGWDRVIFRSKSVKNSRCHIDDDPERVNKKLRLEPNSVKLLYFK